MIVSTCLFGMDAILIGAPIFEARVLSVPTTNGHDNPTPSQSEGHESHPTATNEDSGLERMVVQCMDFVRAVADCYIPKVANLLLKSASMAELLTLLMRYMQIKDSDIYEAQVGR